MYAVVEIAGQQYKVNPTEKLYVPRLDSAVDSTVTFDKVLLRADETSITVGAPTVAGASVAAKVLAHVKDDKVIVFKKKKRKGFQRTHGHRQNLVEIRVRSIEA